MGWLNDPGRRAVLTYCHLSINVVGCISCMPVSLTFVLIPMLAEGGALIINPWAAQQDIAFILLCILCCFAQLASLFCLKLCKPQKLSQLRMNECNSRK